MGFAEPAVVACVGRDALEAQLLVVWVLFAQEGVERHDTGPFRLRQHQGFLDYKEDSKKSIWSFDDVINQD